MFYWVYGHILVEVWLTWIQDQEAVLEQSQNFLKVGKAIKNFNVYL